MFIKWWGYLVNPQIQVFFLRNISGGWGGGSKCKESLGIWVKILSSFPEIRGDLKLATVGLARVPISHFVSPGMPRYILREDNLKVIFSPLCFCENAAAV
jgi:hypothetical protein